MQQTVNGLAFRVEAAPDNDRPPLLLIHGFTGSAGTWADVFDRLAAFARPIAIDVIGHAGSAAPDDPARYRFECWADDARGLLDALELPQADVLGYSMGGRLALYFAVHAPERVRRLVLESASPGLESEAERAQRRAADDALADRIERDGIEAFVDAWEQQPLLALAEGVPSAVRARQRAERLASSPRGLANSLRGMGTGQQPPLWSALAGLHVPVRLIVGERDARYRAVGERMRLSLPNADLRVCAGAGHTVHLDQPDCFVEAVRTALA